MHLRPQRDNSKTNYPCEQGPTGNMAWNTLLTHKFAAWNTLLTHKFAAWNTLLTPPGGVILLRFLVNDLDHSYLLTLCL